MGVLLVETTRRTNLKVFWCNCGFGPNASTIILTPKCDFSFNKKHHYLSLYSPSLPDLLYWSLLFKLTNSFSHRSATIMITTVRTTTPLIFLWTNEYMSIGRSQMPSKEAQVLHPFCCASTTSALVSFFFLWSPIWQLRFCLQEQ